MDSSKVKGWSLFNHSILLPIFSSVIPADFQKETCLEYYTEIICEISYFHKSMKWEIVQYDSLD